jgi:hypothetical protein
MANKPKPTKTKSTTLYCFSPPVMLATLIIETSLALYTVWRYKLTTTTRLVAVLLVTLAVFQLSEYFVCTGYGLRAEQWSRLGYVAITMLPALGLHLLHQLAGKPGRKLVVTAYATMVGFVIYFLSYHAAFIGYQCTGNYVIFQIGLWPARFYGLYYYGWLIVSIVFGVRWANEFKRVGKAAKRKLQMVQALVIGYMVFLVPTALANSVDPATRRGIPSIMCGFAVLFAFILALYIMPRAALHRSR